MFTRNNEASVPRSICPPSGSMDVKDKPNGEKLLILYVN